MNILIERFNSIPLFEQKTEIVERKGLGHPDFICDSIVDRISVALSKEYLKRFGQILHHNIDKALLAAGEAENKFGGGKILKPMKLIIGDRATYFVGAEEIDVSSIAIKTAKNWIKENLRFLDAEKHVEYQVELKQVSAALAEIFKKKDEILGANDTSAVVGYAPLTPTERIVLETEKFLNSKEFKKRYPESGEDIKVMGLRVNNNLDLTIAMAFIDRFIDSEDTYFKRKEEILEEIKQFLKEKTDFNIKGIKLNTLDERGKGEAGLFLTTTGTCAEAADSGQVGRGNRVNGVISLNRPAGNEAGPGKNPVSHVGKIYNLLSHDIANEIFSKVNGVKEVYVWLLSEIGRPINDPKIVIVQYIPETENNLQRIQKEAEEIVQSRLENIQSFCKLLAEGKLSVC
ncbi:MAG: methionine adenosyltransferase [Candidatus Aenigmatarchaeota archaeon]